LPHDNIDYQPDKQWIKEQIEKGHDSFIIRTKDVTLDDWVSSDGKLHKKGEIESDDINEIVVFDTLTIKTKSQLKKLWNKN